jgi:hypothetical protein
MHEQREQVCETCLHEHIGYRCPECGEVRLEENHRERISVIVHRGAKRQGLLAAFILAIFLVFTLIESMTSIPFSVSFISIAVAFLFLGILIFQGWRYSYSLNSLNVKLGKFELTSVTGFLCVSISFTYLLRMIVPVLANNNVANILMSTILVAWLLQISVFAYAMNLLRLQICRTLEIDAKKSGSLSLAGLVFVFVLLFPAGLALWSFIWLRLASLSRRPAVKATPSSAP